MNRFAAKLAGITLALILPFATSAQAQNIAVVNGKAVASSKADAFAKMLAKQGQADTPQLREMIKQELINREVLIQEADKKGLLKNPDVQTEIEFARQSILIRALIGDYMAKNPISDADIQSEYTKFKATQGDKEYRARHILVEKEDEAKSIIAKLKGGAKFEDLAKASKDTGSAANGGDLDWATPSAYVKPFSDALVALKKGELTQTPVQTQFGWHVIRLDDVREAQFPPLDQVRPKIEENLARQKIAAYQQSLVSKAKIQ